MAGRSSRSKLFRGPRLAAISSVRSLSLTGHTLRQPAARSQPLAASLVVPIAVSAGIPGTIAIAAHPSAPPGVGVFVRPGAGGESDFQSGTGSYVVAADHVLTREHSRFATAAGVTRQAGNANRPGELGGEGA